MPAIRETTTAQAYRRYHRTYQTCPVDGRIKPTLSIAVENTMQITDVSLHDCGGHRSKSRSVSWNCTGDWLAVALTDRTAKICTFDTNTVTMRETMVVAGYVSPVTHVRCHPKESNQLCAADTKCIRLWDVRQGAQKSTGRVDVQDSVADVRWSHAGQQLVVTHGESSIHVYDVRKLKMGQARSSSDRSDATHKYRFGKGLVETCMFSPSDKCLIASTTKGGLGELSIWDIDSGTKTMGMVEPKATVYPAHTGPIYSLSFSPNGKRFATGASDSIVGLWDTQYVACTHTVSRSSQFVRSVCFSHDSALIASCSEDGGVDVASAATGELVGTVGLNVPNRPFGGADELAFSPKGYMLACARSPSRSVAPAVTVARIRISR